MRDEVVKILRKRDSIEAVLLAQKLLSALTTEELEALRKLVYAHRWAKALWEKSIEPQLQKVK